MGKDFKNKTKIDKRMLSIDTEKHPEVHRVLSEKYANKKGSEFICEAVAFFINSSEYNERVDESRVREIFHEEIEKFFKNSSYTFEELVGKFKKPRSDINALLNDEDLQDAFEDFEDED